MPLVPFKPWRRRFSYWIRVKSGRRLSNCGKHWRPILAAIAKAADQEVDYRRVISLLS